MTEKDINVLTYWRMHVIDERNAGFGVSDKIFALAIDKYHCHSVGCLVGPLLVLSVISCVQILCSKQVSSN